jgi:signal transduction histidine kinase
MTSRTHQTSGLYGWVTAVARGLRAIWQGWSLSRQFGTCASLVLLPAMWTIGLWVSSRIEDSVTHRAGTNAALYMENYVEPLVQELRTGDQLSPENVRKLGRVLSETPLGQKVLTFKIWGQNGIILASSRPELVGQKFEPSAGLKGAWLGVAKAEFDHLKDAENVFEQASGIPLLEVYFPLRVRGSDRIIAVGEFYEKASDLKAELTQARLMSWLVVSAVTLSMLSALFAIVRRGSKTIEQQQRSLERRVGELTNLLSENQQLRARAQRATARTSENTESYLRRLGADIHDGPAQLISLALLRLDDAIPVEGQPKDEGHPDDRISVRAVLTDALQEIRNLAAGLAVPEIDQLSLSETVATVVQRHENLTGKPVRLECGLLASPVVPPALKLCAYRFIQEGLSNAYRHADGEGQKVSANLDGDVLVLDVTDDGPGIGAVPLSGRSGMGLKGLKDRIESLGGTLKIESCPEHGTRLSARLPLATGMLQDA